ncbi:MAG TPA: MarR family transcriptional regulator [Pseudonocardia sp.]|nr:MarR family transcriptional regulator [Pseudonocardia sp.]
MSDADEPVAGGPDLAGRVRLMVVRLRRRVQSEHSRSALSGVQISALDSLSRFGPLTPRELAVCERIQPPTMTKLIAALEFDGLITRETHPRDRRQLILRTTPVGEQALAAAVRETEEWLGKRLSELSEEDRAAVMAAVDVFNKLAGG